MTTTTNNSSITTITTAKRRARGAAAALAILAGVGLAASPAGAAPQPTKSTEYSAAVSQPSITYIKIAFHVWLTDDNGEPLNDGLSYPQTYGCSGFVAGAAGQIITADHCIDDAGVIEDALNDFVAAESGQWTWSDDGTTMTDEELYDYAASRFTASGDGADGAIVPEVTVFLADEAGGGSYPARIIDHSPLQGGTDVALLKIEADDLPVLDVADSDDSVNVGDPVLTVGYPATTDAVTDAQSAPTYASGTISSVRTREGGLVPVFEVNASISPGMSGGPALDGNGEVVGINSYGANGEVQDLGYIQPASLINEMLRKNGVDNELSSTDQALRDGISAALAGDDATAVDRLSVVVADQPDNEIAQKYLDEAEAAVAAAGPTEVATDRPAGSGETAEDGRNADAGSSAADTAPADERRNDGSTGRPLGLLAGAAGLVMVAATAGIALATRRRPNPPAAEAAYQPVTAPNAPMAPAAPVNPLVQVQPTVPTVPTMPAVDPAMAMAAAQTARFNLAPHYGVSAYAPTQPAPAAPTAPGAWYPQG